MTAYETLEAQFAEATALRHGLNLIGWDQAVHMRAASGPVRAELQARIETIRHRIIGSEEVGQLINAAGAASLSPWQAANLREMTRLHRDAAGVPDTLMHRFVDQAGLTEVRWREARAQDDYRAFAADFATLVELLREVAAIQGEALGLAPYDALLSHYQPGLTEADVDRIFAQLEAALPSLLTDVLAARDVRSFTRPAIPGLSIEAQKKLCADVMGQFGFSFTYGRLDESTHPFSSGMAGDLRITTRYDAHDPLSGLMAVIHETGHALYEDNLPTEWLYQPVGQDRGMVVHEAMSLFFEMQIGRSKPFVSMLWQHLAQAGIEVDLGTLARAVRHVEPGLIRVDADEVTYPLHILLRYDIEKAVLAGRVALDDLPGIWRDGMRHFLGVVPPTDREGILQDAHWPSGSVGYFPTYALGACLAAQLKEAMDKDIDCEAAIEARNLTPILAWLKEKIYSQACLMPFDDLVVQATGRPLSADSLLRHLRSRYVEDGF
ncbi:MAG: carboxypeptidase M32 [Pseudomonadota bacterium]